jgi:hypothetical protein
VLLWIHVIPGLRQGIPTEGVFAAVAGVAAALGFVTERPGVAGLGCLAEGAALAEGKGLPDAFLALDCVCIECDEFVGPDVALEGVAVLGGAAGHGWAELLCALAVALQVEGAVPVVVCGEGGRYSQILRGWCGAVSRTLLDGVQLARTAAVLVEIEAAAAAYLFFTLGGLQAHSSGCHCVAPAAFKECIESSTCTLVC